MSAVVNSEVRSLYDDVGRCYDHVAGLAALAEERLMKCVPGISGWSTAQQMIHVVLASGQMLTAVRRIVERTAPAVSRGRPSVVGRIVLVRGDFPRGKGKAPARSVPPESVSREEMETFISRSRAIFEDAAPLLPEVATASWRLEHHVFGFMNARQWLRMAAIHSDHHFAIIDDILAGQEDAG